jgi:hypothetical protein
MAPGGLGRTAGEVGLGRPDIDATIAVLLSLSQLVLVAILSSKSGILRIVHLTDVLVPPVNRQDSVVLRDVCHGNS